MFEENEKVYFIDLTDGVVQEGRFLEYDRDGMWLRLKGQTANKFVYSNAQYSQVYKSLSDAENELVNIRNKMKENLLKEDKYIEDIIRRLKEHEGSLYTGIIREILYEKTR